MTNLGQWGEEYAAQEYKQQGYKVLDKNYFNRRGKQIGELDFIAVRGRELAFVEVKTRTSARFGTGAESVNSFKQRKLVKACKYFLATHKDYQDFIYRIDVVVVTTNLDRTNTSATILTNAVEDIQ